MCKNHQNEQKIEEIPAVTEQIKDTKENIPLIADFFAHNLGKGPQKFSLPNNLVNVDGYRFIRDYFQYRRCSTVFNDTEMYSLIQYIYQQYNDEGIEWVNKEGKFPKRLNNFCFKTFRKNLEEKDIAEVGNIARKFCPKNSDFIFDIVNSIDWEDGAFGDDGSCYWGDRYGTQKHFNSFKQGRFYAIRFYNGNDNADEFQDVNLNEISEENGIGRCWVLFHNNDAILFNAYGPHSLSTISLMVQKLSGANSKEIKLTNQESYSSFLYINSAKGIILSNKDYEILANINRLDFDIDEKFRSCSNCGGDWHHIEDMQYINESYYCDHCSRNSYCCASCQETYLEDGNTVDGEEYCESCYSDLSYCESCNERHSGNNFELEGVELCESCYDEQHMECEDCSQIFHQDNINENLRCESCQEQEDIRVEELAEKKSNIEEEEGDCEGIGAKVAVNVS